MWLVGLSCLQAGEWLNESFDGLLLGPITSYPGWAGTQYGALTDTTAGVVVHVLPHSPGNCLELPWAPQVPGKRHTVAAFTNFLCRPQANAAPVVRAEAGLYQEKARANLKITLRDSFGQQETALQAITNTGTLWLDGLNTGIPVVTGRYAKTVLHYNLSNHIVTLAYDITNLWQTVNPAAVTSLNYFGFLRLDDTDATAGRVNVDDVRIETFPAGVWAWWRLDDDAPPWLVDHLGSVAPQSSLDPAAGATKGWPRRWYAEGVEYPNAGALRAPAAAGGRVVAESPASSNWTVEAVLRIDAAASEFTLVSLGEGDAYTHTSAMIRVGLNPASKELLFTLRDAQQTTSGSSSFGVNIPALFDGRWHHLALRKSYKFIDYYLDYTHRLPVCSTDLPSDGLYQFGTNSWGFIANEFGDGNPAPEGVVLDELRVTFRALAPAEFLQPAEPIITDFRKLGSPGVCSTEMLTISGATYRVFAVTNLSPHAAWAQVAQVAASGTTTRLILDLVPENWRGFMARRE